MTQGKPYPSTRLADGFRRLATVALLALAGVLAACSAPRLGYEAAPYWLQWEAQRSWDLDDAQAALARERIGRLAAWHRHEQLGPAADWIEGLRRELREAPAPGADDVTRWRLSLDGLWQPLAERAAPDLAALATTLSPAQRVRMRARIDEANARWRRDVHPAGARARASRREERLVERADWFLGDLSIEQREAIRTHVRDTAVHDDLVEAERLARQARILDALDAAGAPGAVQPAATGAAEAAATARIADTLARLWKPEPSRAADVDRLARTNDALIARLIAMTSAAQRNALDRRLAGLARDLRTLAGRR